MTNKTTAAIEEAAKLPTAYQTLNHHLSRVGLTLATAHESILLDAIESHTQAHTEGLREQLMILDKDFCHLSAENSDLSSHIEVVRYNNKILRERVKELESRKSLGIQEARELVNQMLAEEISFSRFVELINEGGVK